MVSFMCNLVHYMELREIYKSSSFSGLWLTSGASFSEPISYFWTVILSWTSLVHSVYALLSHAELCVAAYRACFSSIKENAFPSGRLSRGRTPCLICDHCFPSTRHSGWPNFCSIAFSPLKPLSPLLLLLSDTQAAEFSILLEQGKPLRRLPWLSLSPGSSWLRQAGREPAFCTITSPLRNSALVIEKAKICTTYSSLQETGGVIQDAEILPYFFF